MKHILPTDTVNKILAYLGSKAFAEVSGLIAEIQKVAELYIPQGKPLPPLDDSISTQE